MLDSGMSPEPITPQEMKAIALEEGLRASITLDKLRILMLKEAVDWLCDLTDLPKFEVRRQIANNKGGQVMQNLATINAVRELVKEPNA
jgi:hypothetical protein